MPKSQLRLAIGIVSAGILTLVATMSAPPGAMAATTLPSHSVSARTTAPHAVTAINPIRIKAAPDAPFTYSMLQDVANNQCLNGTTALVALSSCNNNPVDAHILWGASSYDVDGELAYTLTDGENGLCLNGSLDPSHAEVILTRCDTSNPDPHTLWYPLGIGPGTNGYSIQSEFENVSATDIASTDQRPRATPR